MSDLVVDLFGGPGGAARGFVRLGFDVIGVDVEPHAAYPGPVIEADLRDGLPSELDDVDPRYVWCSPPCLKWSRAGGDGEDLIPLARELADQLDPELGYAIENVSEARAELRSPITLSGEAIAFRDELGVRKERLVETSHLATGPERERVSGFEHAVGSKETPADGFREAHGLDADAPIAARDVRDAIPPIYVEWVIKQARRNREPIGEVRAGDRLDAPVDAIVDVDELRDAVADRRLR